MCYALTAAELAAALRASGWARGERFAADLARLAPLVGIDTRCEWGHFIAQCAAETDWFKTTTEYASGRAYDPGRHKDAIRMGNTRVGDGPRYKGRGLLQTTWHDGYLRLRNRLRAGFANIPADPDAPNFEARPELVADMPWCVLSALSYWDMMSLGRYAQDDEVRNAQQVSRGVNRGNPASTRPANHEAQRIEAFCTIMKHLPKR